MNTDLPLFTEKSKRLYDVFLSHHSSDKQQVEKLAVRLEDEARLKPFLDKWHLTPGAPWQEELEDALDRSATCAVFLGANGLGAWENEEMRSALDDRVRNKGFRIIPVLLPQADTKDPKTLPRFLRRLTWVDFRAGLDDNEAFQRLVAGIRGVAPGRRPADSNSVVTPPRGYREIFSSIFVRKQEKRGELWKVALPAVLALLLSAPFINAVIPRYKLLIKSPDFRKEGVYEAPAGMVHIKWVITKERWFRETDVDNIVANLTISKSNGETEAIFQHLPGEARTRLKPGKYEVRIDAVAYQRTETIALQITTSPQSAATETEILTGTIRETTDEGIQGAQVTIDEMPRMTPVETSTDGNFTIIDIPKPHGESVRIRVTKEGYRTHTEDVVLGRTPPRIKLRRVR